MKIHASRFRFAAVTLAFSWLAVACHPAVKQVSTDASRHGSPPLCFDYRGEAQATERAGVSNIWAYLNNTCSYPVDCVIHNDATDQEQRVGVVPYRQLRVLLAQAAPVSRVRLSLECSWNP
ncbi:MAG TPA: hypothetical protein VFK05_11650 [Polyangiaceae bacterium]|nr:hypothetical protein [Polyangiaceae bacterium]